MFPALARFFGAAGCRTQTELAEFLGIRQSSISYAKKMGSIPSDWLLTLWRKKGVNPDWVLWGQETTNSQAAELPEQVKPLTIYVKENRPPEECTIEELVTEIVRRAAKNIS